MPWWTTVCSHHGHSICKIRMWKFNIWFFKKCVANADPVSAVQHSVLSNEWLPKDISRVFLLVSLLTFLSLHFCQGMHVFEKHFRELWWWESCCLTRFIRSFGGLGGSELFKHCSTTLYGTCSSILWTHQMCYKTRKSRVPRADIQIICIGSQHIRALGEVNPIFANVCLIWAIQWVSQSCTGKTIQQPT